MRRIALVLVFASVASLAPLGSRADTKTSNASGVQMIVTTPDIATKTPARRPTAKPQAKLAKAQSRSVVSAASAATSGPSDTNKRYANIVVVTAEELEGRPYRFGGTSPAGFDCSGYTQYVFARAGIAIPRTADAQFAAGRKVAADPLPGDLVFFQTYDYGASHVAVYLGGGRFVNAIGQNVHVADFDSPYFRGRYLGARRFLPD